MAVISAWMLCLATLYIDRLIRPAWMDLCAAHSASSEVCAGFFMLHSLRRNALVIPVKNLVELGRERDMFTFGYTTLLCVAKMKAAAALLGISAVSSRVSGFVAFPTSVCSVSNGDQCSKATRRHALGTPEEGQPPQAERPPERQFISILTVGFHFVRVLLLRGPASSPHPSERRLAWAAAVTTSMVVWIL